MTQWFVPPIALVALQEGDPNRMNIRTTRKIVKFSNPFTMEGGWPSFARRQL
jgi:hypothetical protein